MSFNRVALRVFVCCLALCAITRADEPNRSTNVPPLNFLAETQPENQAKTGGDVERQIENQAPANHPFPATTIPNLDLALIAKRTVSVACLLAAACVVVIYIGHRRAQMNRGNAKQMRVIETMTIAPRCYCDLVQVGDQILVVARDSTGIQSVNPVGMSFGDELNSHTMPSSGTESNTVTATRFERI